MNYDVVIVGASVAGCTAATLFGREGLKVALIDRVAKVDDYKPHCTHYILASAVPVFEKLGVCDSIEQAGGVKARLNFWTRFGWIKSDPNSEYGYNIPRWMLDPMLRNLAKETEGVDLLLETSFDSLKHEKNKVSGVIVKDKEGNLITIEAKLVVGADGRQSKVAKQSNLKRIEKAHNRFASYIYYENLPLSSESHAQVWYTDPDIAYCFPTAEGKTLVATFVAAEKYDSWKSDPVANLERFVGALPGAPDFNKATQVGDIGAMRRLPNVRRSPAKNGLALIGDAALASDPATGVGCSWSLQAALWLVNATAESLKTDKQLDQALTQYCRQHASQLNAHFDVIADESQGKPFNPVQKLIFSAAAKDENLAVQFHHYCNRRVGVYSFLLKQLPRSIWVNLTKKKNVDKENYSYLTNAG